MSITLKNVKCPDCGASLSIEDGREKFFCSYCGAQIIVINENEHIYRTIDEAEVKHAETDQLVKLTQLEIAENIRIAKEKRRSLKN